MLSKVFPRRIYYVKISTVVKFLQNVPYIRKGTSMSKGELLLELDIVTEGKEVVGIEIIPIENHRESEIFTRSLFWGWKYGTTKIRFDDKKVTFIIPDGEEHSFDVSAADVKGLKDFFGKTSGSMSFSEEDLPVFKLMLGERTEEFVAPIKTGEGVLL